MSAPTVTVVVANHNHGRFLASCLDSALAQSHEPLEIIVVDDGSTDDSAEVLSGYVGRIRVIAQDNQGQAAALSVGVEAAEGAFVAFLDADDGWYPEKVSEAVNALTAHPDAGWLRHKMDVVDETRRDMGAVAPRFRGSSAVLPDLRLVLERILTAPTSSIVLRREAADRIFPLPDPEGFRFDADLLMLGKAFEERIPGYSFDRSLGYYRRHAGQRFTDGEDVHRMLSRELEVAAGVARALGRADRSATSAKHRVILEALGGAPAWSARRARPLLAGLMASAQLLDRPGLAARQTAALLLAYLAPNRWLRRQRGTMPLAGDASSGGPP